MQLLMSFASGLCFAFGAVVGVFLTTLVTRKDREAVLKEMRESHKRTEDRMATQVATMAECLKEIQRKGVAKNSELRTQN